MTILLQDLRQAFRLIRKNPGFSLLVILTLGLGIGANTTVFSAVDGVVLNPFPFPESDRLVGVGTEYPKLGVGLSFFEHMSPADFVGLRDQSRTLEDVVAWDIGNRQVPTDGPPVNLRTAFWWGNAFPTLGVDPVLGRGFSEEEITRGDRVAVLSHRLWQNQFGADPEIVGRAIQMNGEPYEVVGIMPPRTLLAGTDFWIPMPVGPEVFPRNSRPLQLLARLASGVTIEQANVELATLAGQVESAFGAEFPQYEGWRMEARTWNDINVGTLRSAATVLFASVGFVLLLICVNLGSLILARANQRVREIALRTTLGARRSRVFRQLLTEGVVLALLGGAVGLGIAYVGVRAASAAVIQVGLLAPGSVVAMNLRALLLTGGVSLVVGILFGLAPMASCFSSRSGQILSREGSGQTGSPGRLRLQRLLIGAEVALALILFVAGGLTARSFIQLQRVDPGFAMEDLLTMRLTLPVERYPGDAQVFFFTELVERTAELPGVTHTAVTNQFPPRAFSRRRIAIEGLLSADETSLPTPYLTVVSAEYFTTLDVPLRLGRLFDRRDVAGSVPVAVVNEVAAERYFGGSDAVGKRFRSGTAEGNQNPWIEVIGVVGATKNRGLTVPSQPEIFVNVLQLPMGWNQLYLVARMEGEQSAVLADIQAQVQEMDPLQPVYAITSVEQAYGFSHARQRVSAIMLSLFAAFAAILAGVGIYSVVAYSVVQRTQEIGLRMALGAGAGRVVKLMVAQLILPVGMGAALGLLGGVRIGHMLENGILFELTGADSVTLVGATALFAGVAVLAGYVPARKAARLDPARTLLRHG